MALINLWSQSLVHCVKHIVLNILTFFNIEYNFYDFFDMRHFVLLVNWK